MAFTKETLLQKSDNPLNQIKEFQYNTTDNIATVKGANYFNYSITDNLDKRANFKKGDTILIIASDNVEFAIVKTVTIANDTATVVINTTVNA